MKRTSHLFLLVPSLFLMASCQTTPKVDTIDEKEAQAFIQEKFTNGMDFFKEKIPTGETTFSWEIIDTKDEASINDAKVVIKSYLGKDVGDQLKSDNVKIAEGEAHRKQYPDQLAEFQFDDPVGDAVIGMNQKIYENLYISSQHKAGYSNIKKKKGPDNGLIIISLLDTSTKSVNTLTHTYNHEGLESKFEVVCSKSDSKMQFKMTIDFHY